MVLSKNPKSNHESSYKHRIKSDWSMETDVKFDCWTDWLYLQNIFIPSYDCCDYFNCCVWYVEPYPYLSNRTRLADVTVNFYSQDNGDRGIKCYLSLEIHVFSNCEDV